jgi:translation initiation factor 2 beta subunit (eIF-2beta)/eIF-5
MEINMNGNQNDVNYRYKMPKPSVTIGGQGNGIYTVFNNMDQISNSINHPVEVLMKYIASITGTSYNPTKKSLTGTHKSDELIEQLLNYIKFLVMCPKCGIPETIPKIKGTKKNINILLCCSACNNESTINTPNKNINKGIDIIIKYLNNGGEWKINKGTMVNVNQTDENNPFALLI